MSPPGQSYPPPPQQGHYHILYTDSKLIPRVLGLGWRVIFNCVARTCLSEIFILNWIYTVYPRSLGPCFIQSLIIWNRPRLLGQRVIQFHFHSKNFLLLKIVVLKFYGNSKIGADLKSEIGDLISLRLSFRTTTLANLNFLAEQIL